MDDLAMTLGFNPADLDKWYSVSVRKLIEHGGAGILKRHGGSLSAILVSIYPDHNWDLRRFLRPPINYWRDVKNQRLFMESLGRTLNFLEANPTPSPATSGSNPNSNSSSDYLDQYYRVTNQIVIDNGGSGLLARFNGSLIALMKQVFPEKNWDPIKFQKVPQNYWSSEDNQKRFMEGLGKKLGIKMVGEEKEMEKWYQISSQVIHENGGGALLSLYYNSLSALLKGVFPSFPWNLSLFRKTPQNYWASLENQRNFMDNMGRKLGIDPAKDNDSMALWYRVKAATLTENGGIGILTYYKGSLFTLFSKVYPNYEWNMWKFSSGTNIDFKSNSVALKELFDYMENALGIKDKMEWTQVTTDSLRKLGVLRHFSKNGGMTRMVCLRYPEVDWDATGFKAKKGFRKASQAWLTSLLQSLFPNQHILENYSPLNLALKEKAKEEKEEGKEKESNQSLQLDIFLPSLNLAFEYQGSSLVDIVIVFSTLIVFTIIVSTTYTVMLYCLGEQHFEQLSAFGETKARMRVDEGKASRCAELGITLIPVQSLIFPSLLFLRNY